MTWRSKTGARYRAAAYVLLAAGLFVALVVVQNHGDQKVLEAQRQATAQVLAVTQKLRAFQLHKCHTDNVVRVNQRVVLASLVKLTVVLDDRAKAGLRPLPDDLLVVLRARLTPLHAPYPDTDCDGTPDPPAGAPGSHPEPERR